MSLPSTLAGKEAPSERGTDSARCGSLAGGRSQWSADQGLSAVCLSAFALHFLPCCGVRECWFGVALPNHTQHLAMSVHLQVRWAAVWMCFLPEAGRGMKAFVCPVYWRPIAKLSPDLCSYDRQADRPSRSFFVVTFKQQPQLPSAPWLGSPFGEVLRVSSPRPQRLSLDLGSSELNI